MIREGHTFLLDRPDLDDHLWVIISDPVLDYEHVVIVNLTTWREKGDPTCIVEEGEHEWVKHTTCVNYRKAKVVRDKFLDACDAKGYVKWLGPVDNDLLGRIRAGAAESPFTPHKVSDILNEQGLLPEEQEGL